MYEITLSDNNSIQVETIDKLTASTPFIHEDRIAQMNVLIYVLTGCIYVTEEDIQYAIQPGEVILLRKGTHQYGQFVTAAGTSWIYVHFQIWSYGTSINDDNQAVDEIQLPKFISISEYPDISEKLYEICSLTTSKRRLSKNLVSAQFQEFLIDLYEVSIPTHEVSMAERINNFLDKNLTKNISSIDLEKEFHLSYKYLAKLYNVSEKNTIMQYHFYHRIMSAARMLRSTDKTISEISDYFGYDNALYFSKCFKKIMGLSPREYRKQVIQTF